MNKNTVIFLGLILLYSGIGFSQDSSLLKLPLMTWMEIPNSKVEAVKPDPLPISQSGFGSIMDAWSGGAYDTQRDRLIVWGGGHTDYSGNEIYVFDLNTLKWIRLTEPSEDVGGNESSGEYPDGNPRARHTYNYIQYIPSTDKFYSFGGAGMYPSGQTGSSKTFSFDFNTLEWKTNSNALSNGIGAFSAVDPTTGHAWVHGTVDQSTTVLSEYDPVNDTWTKRTAFNSELQYNYYLTAAIDFYRKKFVAVGNGDVYVWDISNPDNVSLKKITTSGDKGILNSGSIGFVYDPIDKLFVAWGSGQSIYTLNLDSNEWTKLNPSGANPGNPAANGTFGRFRYVPSINGFILVNGVNKNVFVVKISHSDRPAAPTGLKIQ